MQKFIWLLILPILFISCDYFKSEKIDTPIARVNDTYLYAEDIESLFPEGTTAEDSILLVTNYVHRWATQQLLIDRAKINLPQKEINSYNKLVEQYKTDLYAEAYKRTIVAQQLDSVISDKEIQEYYETHKENFKLNDDLLQLRYVHLATDYDNLNLLKDRLQKFDKASQEELNTLSIQFKSFNLNDSIWVKKENVVEILPVLKDSNLEVLKKSNFTQLEDSLGVYLIKVENSIKRNDRAPLVYVIPAIEQIVLNKRKLELIKKLEKDITKDAIKSKKFEVYPQ